MSGPAYELEEIAQAIADTIKAGTEAPLFTGVAPIGNGSVPAALVEPKVGIFNNAFRRSSDLWEFNIYVMVAPQNLNTARKQLSGLLTGEGPNSIRRAIHEDPHIGLGNHVVAQVIAVDKYGGKAPWYKVDHIGAILLVRVQLT